jgi:hypothetical protein
MKIEICSSRRRGKEKVRIACDGERERKWLICTCVFGSREEGRMRGVHVLWTVLHILY